MIEHSKQEDDETVFNAWCEINFMALNVIHVLCEPDALSIIRQISLAKIACDTLAGFSLSRFLSENFIPNNYLPQELGEKMHSKATLRERETCQSILCNFNQTNLYN